MSDSRSRSRRIYLFARLILGISWDFWRESRISRKVGFREAEKRMEARHRKRAIKFRETALELGGLPIKLGQFMSARVDVMPEPYIMELMKLQDEVPPEEYPLIKKLVEEEIGRPIEEIFQAFNPVPRAAASLGQVHEAVLHTGEKVAVKVQRPGIEELIDIDMGTLAYILLGLNRFTRVGERMDIPGLLDVFSRVVGEELDFLREADSAERFSRDFSEDPLVYIPRVHWEYTTDRIVTLEYIEGIKINDYAALDKAGIDRHRVAQILVDIYVRQFLDHGFFHADPHPGNIFVMPGPVLALMDFGMMGDIKAEARTRFVDALLAIISKDADETIEAAADLGFIRQGANIAPIRNALEWMFNRYTGVRTAKEITLDDIDEIQEDIRMILRDYPFNMPVEFAYLGKTFGTLVGLISGLDPDFDIIEEARPYIDRLGSEVRFEIAMKKIKKTILTLIGLPDRLDRILTRAEKVLTKEEAERDKR